MKKFFCFVMAVSVSCWIGCGGKSESRVDDPADKVAQADKAPAGVESGRNARPPSKDADDKSARSGVDRDKGRQGKRPANEIPSAGDRMKEKTKPNDVMRDDRPDRPDRLADAKSDRGKSGKRDEAVTVSTPLVAAFPNPVKSVGLKKGDLVPQIEGEDIEGVDFRLSDYQGKVIMLDFWGDW